MSEQQLTIGEVAERTGVATSALRYWEELGLLPAPARVSGQRRYPPSAVGLVGAILFLRDVGFTLREIGAFVGSRATAADEGWRAMARRKVTELDQRIAHAQAARDLIAHGMGCPHDDVLDCPKFHRVVAAHMSGSSLEDAHSH